MIFVTVGTQLPFDRMIGTVDSWLEGREIECFAQTAGGELQLRHMKSKPFLDAAEFDDCFARADLVIAHAGMGSILSALSSGKRLLIVPRRAALGEHRNDHQMATARRFESVAGVRVVYDHADLPDVITQMLDGDDEASVERISPYAPDSLINGLRNLIEK